jgi:hypothetical protein
MTSELDTRAIRQRIEVGVQKEKRKMRHVFFIISLVMFIAFSIVAWGMSGLNPMDTANIPGISSNISDPLTSAMIMLNVGWFAALLFQFASIVVDTRVGEQQIRDRVTGREMSKALLDLGEDEAAPIREKAKHMMRLSDDGELEAIVEPEAEDAPVHVQRGQAQ